MGRRRCRSRRKLLGGIPRASSAALVWGDTRFGPELQLLERPALSLPILLGLVDFLPPLLQRYLLLLEFVQIVLVLLPVLDVHALSRLGEPLLLLGKSRADTALVTAIVLQILANLKIERKERIQGWEEAINYM